MATLLVGVRIAQNFLGSKIVLELAHAGPSVNRLLNDFLLMKTISAPPDNGAPGERRGHMDIPPPGMIRNPGPPFGHALDQPLNGSHFIFGGLIAALDPHLAIQRLMC